MEWPVWKDLSKIAIGGNWTDAVSNLAAQFESCCSSITFSSFQNHQGEDNNFGKVNLETLLEDVLWNNWSK